ncbi:MAG: Pr2TM family membrane protein [Rhodobacteraceae bacterium]|nr:Pr2TM family membrane protein [Paracoccaceae bacterium]
MAIQDRRTRHGWTQEQLAQHSGLSTRTIQRIEQGNPATLESLKCLAAVFETDVSTLMQEQTMNPNPPTPTAFQTHSEQDAISYVQNLKAFHLNWIVFVFVIPCLFALNLLVSPGYLWVVIVAVGWLFGIALHAVVIFGLFKLFGAEWEQREFKKRMGQTDR